MQRAAPPLRLRPSTPSEISSQPVAEIPALLPVILHLFLIMQTVGGMSFEDGIDARALCQVHFREICSDLDGQNTRLCHI